MLTVVACRGLPDKRETPRLLSVNGDNGVIHAYQRAYISTDEQILAYMHSDVAVPFDDWHWRTRIEGEFSDPKVAIVGMGGALGIGTPDIYKRPYNIWQLQRIDYYSNQTDWQVHGKREEGARDVAVVDGFFMAVRRSFLDKIGGWSWMQTRFHCYDTALCLMAHRKGWKVRMVGVNCLHHGGRTSTSAEYKAWLEAHGTTQELDHSEPHKWLYDEFRDVLPWRVN